MTALDSVRWPRDTARLELGRATSADLEAIATIRAKPGVSEWLSSGGTAATIVHCNVYDRRQGGVGRADQRRRARQADVSADDLGELRRVVLAALD